MATVICTMYRKSRNKNMSCSRLGTSSSYCEIQTHILYPSYLLQGAVSIRSWHGRYNPDRFSALLTFVSLLSLYVYRFSLSISCLKSARTCSLDLKCISNPSTCSFTVEISSATPFKLAPVLLLPCPDSISRSSLRL